MRDGGCVGSKFCSVDHGWLRYRRGLSARRISELGQQPLRNRDGDPTERRQPADHRDGNYRQITDIEKLLL